VDFPHILVARINPLQYMLKVTSRKPQQKSFEDNVNSISETFWYLLFNCVGEGGEGRERGFCLV
jgi:hypothetical protein